MSDQITITLDASPASIERVGRGLQAMARAMSGEGAVAEPTRTVEAETHTGNDAAPTATGPAGGEEPNATGSAPAGGAASDPSRVDHKGVAFNDDYCGEATDPFYGSGKRAGQWKKKRGVDEDDYDAWYAAELAALGGTGHAEQEAEPPANTAGAFQAPTHQQPAATGCPFTDAGAFMAWVSEKQTAGLLDQNAVQQAYAAQGVQVTDLFPPNAPDAIAASIAKVYAVLSQVAGA